MSDTSELKPLDGCPMCAGAGVVHHRVAFSEVVDRPCPVCIMVRSLEAQLAALEAENRWLREDLRLLLEIYCRDNITVDSEGQILSARYPGDLPIIAEIEARLVNEP